MLPVQTFSTAFSQRQTWGSLNAGVDAVSSLSFFGLNHSFGTVLNNVVNPRFGRGSGGMMFSE